MLRWSIFLSSAILVNSRCYSDVYCILIIQISVEVHNFMRTQEHSHGYLQNPNSLIVNTLKIRNIICDGHRMSGEVRL